MGGNRFSVYLFCGGRPTACRGPGAEGRGHQGTPIETDSKNFLLLQKVRLLLKSEVQQACQVINSYTGSVKRHWRKPFLDFLLHGHMPHLNARMTYQEVIHQFGSGCLDPQLPMYLWDQWNEIEVTFGQETQDQIRTIRFKRLWMRNKGGAKKRSIYAPDWPNRIKRWTAVRAIKFLNRHRVDFEVLVWDDDSMVIRPLQSGGYFVVDWPTHRHKRPVKGVFFSNRPFEWWNPSIVRRVYFHNAGQVRLVRDLQDEMQLRKTGSSMQLRSCLAPWKKRLAD